MTKSIIFAATLVLALSGCTTLKVNNFSGKPDERQGIAYFLPFTQFETTVSWTASCDTNNGNEFGLTPQAEMTPKTGPDPDGLYVIDYRSLDAFTKTSNVKVDFYDNGAIKAINASADDKTGEILSTTLTAVGKFARVAYSGPALTESTQPTFVCSQALINAIRSVEVAKSGTKPSDGSPEVEGVDQKTQKLKAATDLLEAHSIIILRAGASITDAQRSEHLRLVSEVSAAQEELKKATKVLAEARKKITYTAEPISFPARSSVFESIDAIAVTPAVLAKWIAFDPAKFRAKKEDPCSNDCLPVFTDELEKLALENSLWLKIVADSDFSDRYKAADNAPSNAGVRYRIAFPATLKVCGVDKCGGEPIKTFAVQMMNQGTTLYLPFKSKAFTNATLSATFAQNGVLTSAGYEQKRAQGEALAGAVGTLLGEIGTTFEKVREGEKSQLDLVKEQTELAKAEKELADAQAALVEKELNPDDQAIAALKTETALREAEVANINAAIAKIEANRRLSEAEASK